MRQKFDPVESALLTASRRSGKISDHPVDVLLFHHFGKCAVRTLAHAGGGHHRQPIAIIPSGSPPHMSDLAHDSGSVFVNAICEFLEPRNYTVVARIKLAKHRGTVGGNIGRSANHGQGNTPLCFLFVIQSVAVSGMAAIDKTRRMGSADDTIAQRQVLELKRIK